MAAGEILLFLYRVGVRYRGGLGIELGLDTMIISYLQQDSRSTEILFLLKLRIKKK